MKFLIAFAVLAGSLAFGRGGGEGPCPVPEVPLPQVVSKNYLTTSGLVKEIQLFEAAQTLLLRSGGLNLERKRFGESVVTLSADDFALFLKPGEVAGLATLESKSLPAWTDRLERVSGNVAALAVGRRYDVVEARPNGTLRLLCSTPATSGLQLSQGGSRERVYFHAWFNSRLRLFSLGLRHCEWREEARYRRLSAPLSSSLVRTGGSGEAYYASARGLVHLSRKGVTTFKLKAKDVFFLSPKAPGILVWAKNESLSLFFTGKGTSTTLLSRVSGVSAESVAYSEAKRALFLPLWLESESDGVYEFIFH